MTIRELELFTLAAAIAAMWAQIRQWLAWPVSLVIAHRRVDAYSAGIVLNYLRSSARWRPQDASHYSSEKMHIRSLGKVFRVWYEALKESRQVFWLRGRPIWYYPCELGPPNPGQPRETTIGIFGFLRGTVDWEKLLADVSSWEDLNLQEIRDNTRNRFTVVFHGQSSRAAVEQPNAPSPTTETVQNPSYGCRPLHWRLSDLWQRAPLSLESLSLSTELIAAGSRIRSWMDSREWFEERGIPWRLGMALSGAPGTGKTSFARATAVEHNLPIHVFDLAALDNHGLRAAWGEMLRDAPCIALIEDLDAVFEGRRVVESVLKQGIPLTFDCLLNCISGVQAADGVLLIVTTNRPETLDAALLRPGRLDLHVQIGAMDLAGRRKMIDRILPDDVRASCMSCDPMLAELTPAQLQEHLIRIALAERYGEWT